MFTMDEMLSKKNQRLAFAHLASKRDGCGIDGMHVSELEEYWRLNESQISKKLRNQKYQPGIILIREHINKNGKRRNIASLNAIDRFITRLLAQKLNRYIAPIFLENSFAYQDGKGVLPAVMRAKEYIESGKRYVAEIDIKNYFDTIPFDLMIAKIEEQISDVAVFYLIKQYLFCSISFEGKISKKIEGLVQGNAISPVLSNLYLQTFDEMLADNGFCWIRYADNIYLYTDSHEEALNSYHTAISYLEEKLKLTVNQEKSGIFDAGSRSILGYDIIEKDNVVDVRKHIYRETNQYANWHDSRLEFINGKFHILPDGILNRQDYGLLFENEKKKHYIPVEVTDQINIYGNITLASGVLETFNNREVKASFFDKYGNLIGSFIPAKARKTSDTVLKQCKNYMDENIRLDMARRMEIASLHNIRANLKYYEKKNKKEFQESVSTMSEYITQMNCAMSVNEMMLIEAKARQLYYSMFNKILEDEDFRFVQRTKQPPKDALNACISFGNTLLYNHFVSLIWKKGIDPRFGVVHASNRRSQSLNLDFADIFKPIIVDKVIFTLINKKMLTLNTDFENVDSGGIYLTKEGKKIFIQAYEEKMNNKIVVKGKEMSYRQITEQEVQAYKNYLIRDEKYKPYKYY